jgi:hypothetical protein
VEAAGRARARAGAGAVRAALRPGPGRTGIVFAPTAATKRLTKEACPATR